MKNQGILVERYSQALFSLTQQQNNSNEVLSDFANIKTALSKGMDDKLFFSTLFPNSAQLNLWGVLLKNLKCTKTISGFVELLVKNSRIQLFNKIHSRYLGLVNESQGIITAEIVSADALDDKFTKKVKKELESLTNKKIDLISRQDSTLIGGFVIKIGSKLYDSSIKSLLKNIEKTLRNHKE